MSWDEYKLGFNARTKLHLGAKQSLYQRLLFSQLTKLFFVLSVHTKQHVMYNTGNQ